MVNSDDVYSGFKKLGKFSYFLFSAPVLSLDHTISLSMSLMVSKQRKKKCKSIKMIFLNPFLYT
jgi:hypothetical protein